MRGSGLVVACVLTAILAAGAAVFRTAAATGDQTALPDRLLVVLIAIALLLTALLVMSRAPAIAWAATAAAAALATIEIVAAVRALESTTTGSAWRSLTAIAGLSLVTAASITAAYAGRRWRAASAITRGALLAIGAGLVATVGASVLAIVQAGQVAGELTPLRTAARIGLLTIAAGLLVGALRDLVPPAARSYRHSRTTADASPGGRLWRFGAALADELLPGRVADRRRAAESERARLAADLHALVLPELRRAAATAEAAGMPADVQVDLRRALEDVEQLMHERQSIVLEQFGLVAALEWLADRTEERSPLRVELELDGDVPDQPGAADPAVARAAFRIALLALDNVVRHAGATTATLRLAATPDALRLQVIDNGAGTEADLRNGRGIADMRAAATGSGGTVEVTIGDASRVEAAWSRAPRRT